MNYFDWFVITGGPCSGKTTVITKLAELGFITVPEAARVFIIEEMNKGKTLNEIRKNEADFQKKILKIKIKLEKEAPRDKIVFFDRAIPDSIAYYQICGLNPNEVLKLCKTRIYKKIFFLEQLPIKQDYARTEDGVTIRKLNRLLEKSYRDLGYKVIKIPVTSIKNRLQKILNEIK